MSNFSYPRWCLPPLSALYWSKLIVNCSTHGALGSGGLGNKVCIKGSGAQALPLYFLADPFPRCYRILACLPLIWSFFPQTKRAMYCLHPALINFRSACCFLLLSLPFRSARCFLVRSLPFWPVHRQFLFLIGSEVGFFVWSAFVGSILSAMVWFTIRIAGLSDWLLR